MNPNNPLDERKTQRVVGHMAGEDPMFAQAINTPPPNSAEVSHIPELEKRGLDEFRHYMTENAFNTFLTIVHWAILQQDMNDGKEIAYTNETYAAMNAVFVGFGNPYLWENTYAQNIGKHLQLFHFNWYSKGPRYRRENKLPHKIVRELAGAFANTSRGWKNAEMIQDLVEDPRTYEKL